MMALLGVKASCRKWVDGDVPLKGIFWLWPLPVTLSASWQPQGKQLCPATPFHQAILPHHIPETMEPVDHGLKLLKL
jgi:hypothetical protein